MKRILVCGSSGFIGSNMVAKFQKEGHYVIGVDIEQPRYSIPDQFVKWDMRQDWHTYCETSEISEGVDEAYCLACLMGGMGYIGDEEKYGYDIAIGSTEIVINFIRLCKWFSVPKIFYSSSACVYNQNLQMNANVVALKEADCFPAFPDLLYGWQKLYAEKMFQTSGLDVRIARFHNIFGQWQRKKKYSIFQLKTPRSLECTHGHSLTCQLLKKISFTCATSRCESWTRNAEWFTALRSYQIN